MATPKKTNVAKVLDELAEKIHRRSLVIIFSDMFDNHENTDDLFQALQHLKHNKHEVIVFHVMDNQTELLFNFEDRPMEFVDLESGERLKLNPGDVKESYQANASRFHKALKLQVQPVQDRFYRGRYSKRFQCHPADVFYLRSRPMRAAGRFKAPSGSNQNTPPLLHSRRCLQSPLRNSDKC